MTPGNTQPNHDALMDQFWDYLQGELPSEQVVSFETAMRNSPEAVQAGVDLIEVMVMTREVCQRESEARKELFLGASAEHKLDDVISVVADPKAHTAKITLAQLAQLEAQADAEVVHLSKDRPSVHRKDRATKEPPLTFHQVLDAGGYMLRHSLKTKAAAITGLAAALLLALFVISPWSSQPTGPIEQGPDEATPLAARPTATIKAVATLTAQHSATWGATPAQRASARGSDLRTGSKLYPGTRLTLTAGFAEITTHRGAIIILEAPATIEFTNNKNAIRLHAGKLVGICETASSKGFVVKTTQADIVDLGTVFGVEVLNESATEVHVIEGLVQVARRGENGGLGPFVEVLAAQAVRLDQAAERVAFIPADVDQFTIDYTDAIDLVDIIAGGDGRSGRRDAGIDPRDGRTHTQPMQGTQWMRKGGAGFNLVPDRPLVAGVMIPNKHGVSTQLDPAGSTDTRLTTSPSPVTFGYVWAGGAIPAPSDQPPLDTVIAGVDYAATGRGLVYMHANAGICFDLAELRNKYPGMKTESFRTGLYNCGDRRLQKQTPADAPQADHPKIDAWVYVDGRLRAQSVGVTSADGLIDIVAPLDAGDRYLTIVVTDALDGTNYDWALLCQPRIDMLPLSQ